MTTSRGLDRLLAFGDATVAIAMTLLVLPLVDIAQSIDDRPVGDYLDEHRGDLLVFALSFLVIGVFWRGHLQMYEHVDVYNQPLVIANLVWLASIVFLPFPTELLGNTNNEPWTYGLYVGTMLLTSLSSLAQKWLIIRAEGAGEDARSVVSQVTLALLMLIALLIATLAPAIGLWSLLLLIASAPAEALLRKAPRLLPHFS
jgi:uncharacterized membrane protein